MENTFNVVYLATVWILVILMYRNKAKIRTDERSLAGRFLLAFFLLAAGDSFHVGARVLSALLGPENSFINLGGIRYSILGLGMLATAYTMTGFYMVFAEARIHNARKKPDFAFWFMQTLLSLRLIIMAIPGNAWETSTPPWGMSLLRNLPLAVAGFLLAILFIREGNQRSDKTWKATGWAMVASYGFYTPVILFASAIPALGLLMIPKTVAYVVMGLLLYRRYWKG